MFVDERAIIVQLRWVLWSQRARWQTGADLLIILKFIALRVEARGDGPFFCIPTLILLYEWIVPTIQKLDKMPLSPASKDKETFS